MPSESPTSSTSAPASSNNRANVASYAVRTEIFSPFCFICRRVWMVTRCAFIPPVLSIVSGSSFLESRAAPSRLRAPNDYRPGPYHDLVRHLLCVTDTCTCPRACDSVRWICVRAAKQRMAVMKRMGLALALCLTGCLMPGQQPTGNVVATGEQLAVVDDVKVWTTTYKEKVAETEYTDANGNVVGKGAVYQDKTATHTMAIWYPVQGKQQLRDEDFFKIAGDKSALDQTLAMRQNGEKWHTRGLIIMGAGLAGMIGGYIT